MIVDFLSSSEPALLALADGSLFRGISLGVSGETVGEVVFNTSMTGYQEILTDPSYAQQIVTLTYPHIGNTGINDQDNESDRVCAAGLIVRECSHLMTHWQAKESLPAFLKAQKIVAIANIDTRQLTHILREKGAQHGWIITGNVDPDVALKKARAFAGLNHNDLAMTFTTQKKQVFIGGHQHLYHIVVYDFGVKKNILRMLEKRQCKVTVVPADASVHDVLALNPNGIVFSNGPGDPAVCHDAIDAAKLFLERKIPLFGICLGFQILALACGAQIYKMKFGHHGANHPVQDLRTQKVLISSQNHRFCVDEKTLPADLEITHMSLLDKTLQGIKHKMLPMMAFQGHPEAGPGPNDLQMLFDEFIHLCGSIHT